MSGASKVLLVLENIRRSVSHSKVTLKNLEIQSLLMRIVEVKNKIVHKRIPIRNKKHMCIGSCAFT